MTPEQQQHIDGIVARFSVECRAKYAAGQQEHGGDLFRKPAMLRHLREELLDLVVYHDTAVSQLRAVVTQLETALRVGQWSFVEGALARLDALLAQETGE